MVGKGTRAPYCKRCGYEIESGKERCPECGYNPRQKGLKLAMGFFLLFVITMTLIILLLQFAPGVTSSLLLLAMLFFALAMLTYFISLLATPYRLGGLFDRY